MLENKIAQTKQEFTNIRIEINSIQQDYTEKSAKLKANAFKVIVK